MRLAMVLHSFIAWLYSADLRPGNSTRRRTENFVLGAGSPKARYMLLHGVASRSFFKQFQSFVDVPSIRRRGEFW